MPPPSITILLNTIIIDRSVSVPLYRQVYRGLQETILSGRLLPGTRLPPTRTLADALGVSRNTVVSAFEQLGAEGYLEARVGAGTFVTRALPDELMRVRGLSARKREVTRPSPSRSTDALSDRGRTIAQLALSRLRDSERMRAFRPGIPALDAFPIDVWSRLVNRRWRSTPPDALTYGTAGGYAPLREEIARYLRTARGVRCTATQVIIVSGTQQAVVLAARALLDPGDHVWFEDPGYPRARGAFVAAGATPVPVPIDDEGLCLSTGRARTMTARMAYVTPSHQYPLGTTMSLQRRIELLGWADRSNAWVLEDDYDSEYRYVGRPLAALQGLDTAGRVVYVGTFSKVLFPALRLGYLVVPKALVDAFEAARALADRCSPLVDQMVVADFMREGHFERHVRQMRTLYASRQAMLVEVATQQLGDVLEITSDEAGLHLVGRLPESLDDRKVARALDMRGVVAPPLSFYATEPLARGGLVLGYGAVDEEAICTGIGHIAEVLDAFL